VPLPFSGDAPPYGFTSSPATSTWLPQPLDWAPLTVAAQEHDPDSTLVLYQRAVAARRRLFDDDSPVEWIDAPAGVLAFARGGTQCWVNTGSTEIALPPALSVILASDSAMSGGTLPPDTTAWLAGRSQR